MRNSALLFTLALAAALAGCGGNRIETTGSSPGDVDNPPAQTSFTPSEPQFVKEGKLQFISEKEDTLARIDIEVAATDAEREKGLMFRTTIAEMTGMLFLFDEADMQSFWMKNTPSSLDILFLSPQNRILNIHEFTTPYSTQGLPSKGLSDKVLEVKGGFCQKYKIKPGDRIVYQLDNKLGS